MLAVVAIVLVGCKKEKAEVDPTLLTGRWLAASQADGAKASDHIGFVFQSKVCDLEGAPAGTCWGYQWDEGDDVKESDVINAGHNDPNWFGWELSSDRSTIIIYSSSKQGRWEGYTARNHVSAFSATSMTMTDAGKTYVFTKHNN